ncbi:MAG: hypothetical protein J0L93_03805 [Deltaproteobacteria bacterium]|nr:hypothetical protein [Deltaproteobacteria bacterium]
MRFLSIIWMFLWVFIAGQTRAEPSTSPTTNNEVTASKASLRDQIGEFRYYDYLSMLRRLMILGDRTQDSGLFFEQKFALERLKTEFDSLKNSSDPLAIELLQSKSAHLFNFNQAIIDWAWEFDYGIRNNEDALRENLEKIIQSLPEDLQKNISEENPFPAVVIDSALERMSLEMEQKKFILKHPLFSEAMIFPGLRGVALEKYLKIIRPKNIDKISPLVIEKIKNDEVLNFEDYSVYERASSGDDISLQDILSAYLFYRSLGSISRSPALSEKEFVEHFSKMYREVLDIASRLQLKAPAAFPAEDIQFLWLIYQAATNSSPIISLDVDFAKPNAKENLSGAIWVSEEYAKKNKKFWSSVRDIQPDQAGYSENLAKLSALIDEWVERNFDSSQFDFQAALLQIQDNTWSFDGRKNFSYYRLDEGSKNPELRNLFSARIFPDLSLREGKALLEQRFFDLPKKDQDSLVQKIFLDSSGLVEFLKRLSQINTKDPAAIQKFHEFLVATYLKNRQVEQANDWAWEAVPTNKLLDGSVLPDIKSAKNRMNRLVEAHGHEFDYGSYSKISPLVDFLTVNIFPYDGYFSDEFKHMGNAYKLRAEHQKHIETLAPLWEKYSKLSEGEEKRALALQIDAATKNYAVFTELHSVDPESLGEMAGAFVYGVLPHRVSDIPSIAANVGMGFAFYWAGRWLGGKVVVVLLFDTAARLISAKYFNEKDKTWLTMDLNKGFSIPILPIGKWTAEFLQHTARTAVAIANASTANERQDHLQEFGEITGGFISFSAGSLIAHMRFDFTTISRIRTIEKLKSQIRDVQSAMESSSKQLEGLSTRLQEVQKKLVNEKSTLGANDFQKLAKEEINLKSKISDIQDGIFSRHQNHFFMLIKQMGWQSAKLINGIFNPLAWAGGLAKKFLPEKFLKQSFKAAEAFQIKNFEAEILRLEQKIAAQEKMLFQREAILNPTTAKLNLDLTRLNPADYAIYKWNSMALHLDFSRLKVRIRGTLAKTGKALSNSIDQLEIAKTSASPKAALEQSIQSLSEASQSFGNYATASTELAGGSLYRLNRIADASNPPSLLTWRHEFLLRMENFRRALLNRHPEKIEMKAGVASEKYFSENYIRLRSQLELLKATEEKLMSQMKRNQFIENEPLLMDELMHIHKLNEAHAQALSKLRARFENYLRSRN